VHGWVSCLGVRVAVSYCKRAVWAGLIFLAPRFAEKKFIFLLFSGRFRQKKNLFRSPASWGQSKFIFLFFYGQFSKKINFFCSLLPGSFKKEKNIVLGRSAQAKKKLRIDFVGMAQCHGSFFCLVLL
jgi:hypothetical protein